MIDTKEMEIYLVSNSEYFSVRNSENYKKTQVDN